MTKAELLKPYDNDKELRMMLSKVLDREAETRNREVLAHSSFFTMREREDVQKMLLQAGSRNQVFYGGYLGAERVICIFLPSWLSEENCVEEQICPLCAVEVTVSSMANLSHRDYLGSLMGVGLLREKFGDILLTEHGCQLILLKEVLPIVLTQWESVGKYPIAVCEIGLSQVELPQNTQIQKEGSIASLRIDNVISLGFSIKRSQAVKLIEAGKVLRNDRQCEKVNQIVREQDRFSCRGVGKFVLTKVKGTSRKGRFIVVMDCYQ